MTVLSVGVRVNSRDPMTVARSLLGGTFAGDFPGIPRVLEVGGDVWEWYGGVWARRSQEWLEDAVWLALERARVESWDGETMTDAPFRPEKGEVAGVVRAIQALVRCKGALAPVWLASEGCPTENVRECVAVGDVVVDVAATARMRRGGGTGWVVFPRDQRWFDPVVVEVEWRPEARCPVWLEAVGQWGNGEPLFAALMRRMGGYVLMPTRKYERGGLLIGPARSGKSTVLKLWSRLLGKAGVVVDNMEGLVDRFGLDGIRHARHVQVPEVSELDSASGHRFAGTWKNLVGRDQLRVKVKHVRNGPAEDVEVFPVMASNEIPKLPNKGQGISSKLLVLPFERSFVRAERFDLGDRLWEERVGIVVWMLEGAVELEMEQDPALKWPVPAAAAEKMRLFYLENHALEMFLESRFVREPGGFVGGDLVRRQWRDWVQANGVRMYVPDNMLLVKIEQETTWGVERYRQANGGERGLRGMLLRREAEDMQ